MGVDLYFVLPPDESVFVGWRKKRATANHQHSNKRWGTGRKITPELLSLSDIVKVIKPVHDLTETVFKPGRPFGHFPFFIDSENTICLCVFKFDKDIIVTCAAAGKKITGKISPIWYSWA
jgi:hypothetical protein